MFFKHWAWTHISWGNVVGQNQILTTCSRPLRNSTIYPPEFVRSLKIMTHCILVRAFWDLFWCENHRRELFSLLSVSPRLRKRSRNLAKRTGSQHTHTQWQSLYFVKHTLDRLAYLRQQGKEGEHTKFIRGMFPTPLESLNKWNHPPLLASTSPSLWMFLIKHITGTIS